VPLEIPALTDTRTSTLARDEFPSLTTSCSESVSLLAFTSATMLTSGRIPLLNGAGTAAHSPCYTTASAAAPFNCRPSIASASSPPSRCFASLSLHLTHPHLLLAHPCPPPRSPRPHPARGRAPGTAAPPPPPPAPLLTPELLQQILAPGGAGRSERHLRSHSSRRHRRWVLVLLVPV
jgi:hypothetical protein